MCIADSLRVNGNVCIVLFGWNDNSTRPACTRETCNAGAPNRAHVSSMKPLKLILHADLRKNTSGNKCRPSRPANSCAIYLYIEIYSSSPIIQLSDVAAGGSRRIWSIFFGYLLCGNCGIF